MNIKKPKTGPVSGQSPATTWRKDTSFAALNVRQGPAAAKITEIGDLKAEQSEETGKDFGVADLDDFLNQRSELFAYYKHKDYSVEPFQLNSIDEAIEDHDLKERNYQNLVYSAANLNRPVPQCDVCKLDHVPLQKDLLAERVAKKEAKKDMKKLTIKNDLLNEIEKQKRCPKGTLKPL